MIDFTLSKINLLILAVALFSIMSFFAFNLGQIFVVEEARQKLDEFATVLSNSLASPTTCDSQRIVIPPKFVSFGNNIYYRMLINQIPDTQTAGNRVIFGVSDVRNPSTVFASASFATDAEVIIYDNAGGTFQALSGEELVLDAQAVPPRNAFVAVKMIKAGQKKLHIIPCAITVNSQTCSDNKTFVNQTLAVEEQFKC